MVARGGEGSRARVGRERSAAGLGAWLVASAPRGEPLLDAERGSRRAIPFAEDDDDPEPTELTANQDARLADLERRERLMAWVAPVRERFEVRLVDVAGRLRAAASARGRAIDPVDALVAASALVRSATVATRNVRDFEPLGVDVVDPWVGA